MPPEERTGSGSAPAVTYPRLAAWLSRHGARAYAKGAVLFHDGDPYRGAVFLLEGTVTLRKSSARGRALILAIETAGHLFAEVPHLTGEATYAVTAQCVEPSRIARLAPADLEAALSDPLVGREIVENLARKLHRFRQSIFDYTLTDAQRRLHRFLETLARAGHRGGTQAILPATVALPITKHELAELMGITAETLSRTFEGLEKAGAAVRLEGRSLRLLRWSDRDPD